MFRKKIVFYYNFLKAKKIDDLLIIIGLIGVVIGLVFSVSFINQSFVWLVLFGVCIKLYAFTIKIERDIVPYDFNKLLPAPKK